MKKELIVNILFAFLYLVITSIVLAYSYGLRPNIPENTSTNSITLVKTGAINVEADGDNNKVYVNEEYYGTAPIRIDGLVPENYKITIKKEGYDNFESIVKVIADTYINVKPELLKSVFGGKLIFSENITENFTYKFLTTNNNFVILSLNNTNTLSVSRLSIQNPIIGIFKDTTKDSFEIDNFDKINLKDTIWGVDDSNSMLYVYNKEKNVIHFIDLISKSSNNSLDLNSIIIPENIIGFGQNLYISNAEKVYTYNFQSKSISIKYTQTEEKFNYSRSNPTLLFNNSKLRILSSNPSLNEYSEINLKSPKNDTDKIINVNKISRTNLYLLIGADYIEVIDPKSEQKYFKKVTTKQISSDSLHILTNNSILKFSYEKSGYIEDLFSTTLQTSTSNNSFNFQDISSFKVFTGRNAFIFKNGDQEYISDYFLSSINTIPRPENSVQFQTILDSYDNLYLVSIENTLNRSQENNITKSLVIYKY